MTLLLAPPVDLGWPMLLPICGAGALVLLVIIIAVEAIVLRRMLPGGRALRDSVLINLASTILGIPLTVLWVNLPLEQSGGWTYAVLAALWALTVGIELLVLRWLERAPSWRKLAGALALANLVSYLLLAAVFVGLGLLAE